MIECFFDGAAWPNPGGHGGYGMLAIDGGKGIFSEAVYIGRWPDLSNNCAEYCGAIGVLRWLIKNGVQRALVRGDADLVINQLNGRWRAKGGAYLPFYQEAWALRQKVPGVEFRWIPREMNDRADVLSKEAVSRRPLVVGFALDSTVQLVAPPNLKRTKRTRDIRRELGQQLVLAPDLDENAIIETFKREYGAR